MEFKTTADDNAYSMFVPSTLRSNPISQLDFRCVQNVISICAHKKQTQ